MGSEKLRWGIIGTGAIAHTLARAIKDSKTGALAAVGSRSRVTADTFAREFSIPKAHGSYEALIEDSSVQAVYVSTPHSSHAEWSIRAAKAGKHVLCEKPMTLSHADTSSVVEAAKANGVFLMEAFMYRCHPQTKRLAELIREKAIGDVRTVTPSTPKAGSTARPWAAGASWTWGAIPCPCPGSSPGRRRGNRSSTPSRSKGSRRWAPRGWTIGPRP